MTKIKKNLTVTKLKTSNCVKTKRIIFKEIKIQKKNKNKKIYKILTKLKISNCDKTQTSKCDKTLKLIV